MRPARSAKSRGILLCAAGGVGLIGSFIWMLLVRRSTGGFLLLAGASAAVLTDGISILCKSQNP